MKGPSLSMQLQRRARRQQQVPATATAGPLLKQKSSWLLLKCCAAEMLGLAFRGTLLEIVVLADPGMDLIDVLRLLQGLGMLKGLNRSLCGDIGLVFSPSWEAVEFTS